LLNSKHTIPNIVLIGFFSIIAQIILLQEFIFIFQGNELIIGIVLSLWMLFTGLGATLKKFILKTKVFPSVLFLQIAYSILPIFMLFSIIWLKSFFAVDGAILHLGDIILISTIIVIPFCLINGILFVSYSQFLSKKENSNNITRTYMYEVLGSIIGGFIFSFFMVFYLSTFTSLLLILIISTVLVLLISIKNKQIILIILSLIIIPIAVFSLLKFDLNKHYFDKIFTNQKYIEEIRSVYGRIIITENKEQKNYYVNNSLIFSDDDIIKAEESVHYGMLQHKNPKKILLISGGLNGCINEVLKYNISKLDYIDNNPQVVNIVKEKTKLEGNNKLDFIIEDPIKFIKTTKNKYDVILINTPEPYTLNLNRFYTVEFFQNLKKISSKNSIISLSLNSEPNYMSDENAILHKIILNSLNESFKNIEIIPGTRNYFIASNSPVKKTISSLCEKQNIENLYVNKYYIDDFSIIEKNKTILESLPKIATKNKDLHAISFYNQILFWLKSIHGIKINPIFLILFFSAILLILFFVYKPISFGMFTSAFTGSFAEIGLVFLYQILFGYTYFSIGLMFSLFMLGLFVGTYFARKKQSENLLLEVNKIQILVVLYSIVLLISFIILPKIQNTILPMIIIMALVFTIAFLIANHFAIISNRKNQSIIKIASNNYNADMLGGAFGAICVVIVLIPLFGIVNSCFIIIGLNVLSIVFNFSRKKSF
jgi:predicted membrane-bound spermidine synthase